MANGFTLNAALRLKLDSGSVGRVQRELNRLVVPAFAAGRELGQTAALARDAGASFGQMATAAKTARTAVTGFAGASVPALQRVTAAANAAAAAIGSIGPAAAKAGRASAAFGVGGGAGGGGGAGNAPRLTGQLLSLQAAAAGVGTAVRRGFAGVENAGRGAFSHIVEYQREMVRLRQVAEESGGAISGVGSEVDRLSRRFGTSSTDLLKQSTALKAAGLSISDVKLSMEAVGKATLAPSFGESKNATDALVASMAVFGRSGRDAERTLGTLNSLSNAYAASAEDIVDSLKRGGGAWRAAGGDLAGFAAAATVAKAKTQESASTIGVSMKAISARLQRPRTLSELSDLGIDLKGQDGLFVGPEEALRRTAGAVAGLRPGDTRRAQIVETVAGMHHVSRAEALLSNWGEVERATVVGRAGESSLDTSATQALDAFETKLNRIREAWLSTAREFADGKGFARLVGGLEAGATAAAGLASALAPVLPLVAGLGAARLGAAYLPALAGAGVGGALARGRIAGGVGLASAGVMAPTLVESAYGRPGSRPGSETAAGLGGALQGGALGAAVGSAFGPVGVAVGGVVGALAGFRSALSDASASVRQAKLDDQLTRLAAVADSMSKGGSPGDPAEAARLTSRTRLLAREAGGGDAGAERAELKKAFGPNVTAYVNALSAEATRAGRRSPTADPDSLVKGFADTNREMLRVVADLSNRTTADAAADFARLVKAGQVDAKALARDDRATGDAARVATGFGRLVDAADRAGRGLASIDDRAAALAGGLDLPRFAGPDPTDASALRPLGAAGRPLADALSAVADLERSLPAAIARAAAANALDGESFAELVASGVKDVLGAGATRGETGRGLSLVTAGFGRRELDELMRTTTNDISGLAREALAGFAGPAREAAAAVAKAGSDAADKIAGLVNAGNRAGATAGAGEDALAVIRAERSRLPYLARGTDPASYMTAAQLGEPFAASQRRLAGGLGFDPAGMSTRLTAVRGELAAAARTPAPPGPGAADAALKLGRLTSEAENLRTALAGLADTTRATAGIQERLSALQSNRESRLSYAERFLVADAGERAKMTRGYAAAIDAGRAGSVRNLGPARTREVFESLNALGAAKLPELGGERAADVKRRLLGEFAGIAPADDREEADLRAELDAAFRRAEEAQKALNADQRRLQSEYFSLARQTNAEFLSKLGAELKAAALADAEAKAGATGRRLGDLKADKAGFDLLRKAGIDNDEELGALHARRSDVAELAGSLERDAKMSAARQASVGRLGTLPSFTLADKRDPMGAARERIDALSDSMTPDQRDAALSDFAGRWKGELDAVSSKDENLGTSLEHRTRVITGSIRDSLMRSVRGTFDRGIDGERASQLGIAHKLAPAGIDWPGLRSAVGSGGGAAFLAALDKFDGAGSFGRFGKRLSDTSAEFDRLTAATARLRANIDAGRGRPPGAGGMSGGTGGGGFVPRGSDTVPLMATPGEFVVNREDAAKNGPLLQRINDGLPPVYKADGGFVGPAPWGRWRDDVPAPSSGPTAAQLAERSYRMADAARKARERPAAPPAFVGPPAPSPVVGAPVPDRPLNPWVGAARFGGGLAERMGAAGFDPQPSPVPELVGPPEPPAGREKRLREALAAEHAAINGAAPPPRPRNGWHRAGDGPLGRPVVNGWGGSDLRERQAKFRADRRADFAAISARTRRLQSVLPAGIGAMPHDPTDPGYLARMADGAARIDAWKAGATPTAPPGPRPGVRPDLMAEPVRRFAFGGVVPGASVADSVPALLRGGEGVLTPNGMRAVGGPAGLAAANNAGADGGGRQAFGGDKLTAALAAFVGPADKLALALRLFVPAADRLAAAIAKIPKEIQARGEFTHRHDHYGDDRRTQAEGVSEARVQDIVHEAIGDRLPNAEPRRAGR